MKKLGILFLCIFSILLFSIKIYSIKAAPVATLTNFYGEVYYKAFKSNEWSLVKKGHLIYEGDTLRSEENGKAIIYFSNKTKVVLSPDSEIEFNKIDKKRPKKRSIFMKKGRTYNKVVTGTEYEVESVYAIAAVKGTSFGVTFDENGHETHIEEGIVIITSKSDNKSIRATEGILATVTNISSVSEQVPYVPGDEVILVNHYISKIAPKLQRANEEFQFTVFIKDKNNNLISENMDILLTVQDENDNSTLVIYDESGKKVDGPVTISNGKKVFKGIISTEKRHTFKLTVTGDQNTEIFEHDITGLPEKKDKDFEVMFDNFKVFLKLKKK